MTGYLRKCGGRFERPPHFRAIPTTRIDVGYLQKMLKFHDAMTGKLYSAEEFSQFVVTLPETEQMIIEQFLKRRGMI